MTNPEPTTPTFLLTFAQDFLPQNQGGGSTGCFRELGRNWKGDSATAGAGRARARAWYSLFPVCAECENAPARERHHWDGNALNNESVNVVGLCRRCHMRIDGRLENFKATAYRTPARSPVICVRCGQEREHAAKGLCGPCYSRQWRERRVR